MSVERGGRGPSKQELEARAEAAAQRAKVQQEQLEDDIRWLLRQPQFQRYAQYLMAKCNTFGLEETLQASTDFRNQARRGVGLELSNDWARADRKLATELMAKMLYANLEPEKG